LWGVLEAAVEIQQGDGRHTGERLRTQRLADLATAARKEVAEARDKADLDQKNESMLSRSRL
jgi:hypothetical protein